MDAYGVQRQIDKILAVDVLPWLRAVSVAVA
jgi:hypothetical protein